MTAAERLADLRRQLSHQRLDGFIVPLTDEHFSEYVGGYAKRLEWLTGFTGSAGAAVVLAEKAAMFVDGRYTLQVRQQVDDVLYGFETIPDTSIATWLADQAARDARIGYDPWLHTRSWLKSASAKLKPYGVNLVPVETNPVDAIWADRPTPSLAPIETYPEAFAGKSRPEKCIEIAAAVTKMHADAAVISALDSIAWALNIRGVDVDHTPVARAFMIMEADGASTLFTEIEKVTDKIRAALGGVKILPRTAFTQTLTALGGRKARVLLDPDATVAAIVTTIEQAGGTIVEGQDPCVLPKARKTPAEVAGTRAAHHRDGLAVSRFLHWLSDSAPRGEVDELTAVDRLLDFRRQSNLLRDTSFDTIAGSGPNGAIVHYRSTPSTNRRLTPGELFLLDSGGQYLDGTTDITRTVAIGPAGPEERDRFTRVLKGHIAIATCRFPKGSSGRQLDTLARHHLWQAGLDYDHGTGHGVGVYLGVHEGPQRIAKAGPDVPLEPGMIVSNEPGYYKTGAYGIRIENLVLVQEAVVDGDERPMLGFETLTLAPIDLALIDARMLTVAERDWLNAYHARVREALVPDAPAETRAWLVNATQPL